MEHSEAIRQSERGVKARSILDNETLRTAFGEIGQDNFNRFVEADPNDTATLTRICAEHRALQAIRSKLHAFINAGKSADAQLKKPHG